MIEHDVFIYIAAVLRVDGDVARRVGDLCVLRARYWAKQARALEKQK